MPPDVPPDVQAALADLVGRWEGLDGSGLRALWVGGSLATGDHVPGVSDLDLVAVTTAAPEPAHLRRVHEAMDAGPARGMDLGCQYVESARLAQVDAAHPTWTHGGLVERPVSRITRAELVLHGYSLRGPEPRELLDPVTPDDVRAAARSELAGYWARAALHPLWFVVSPVMVDLGLTSMARARHGVDTGELLTKSGALEQVHAPDWLRAQLQARRRGEDVGSPRMRSAYLAWRDVRRTTRTRGASSKL